MDVELEPSKARGQIRQESWQFLGLFASLKKAVGR
jgi:hypothetical protein